MTATQTSLLSDSSDELGELLTTLWAFAPGRALHVAVDAGFFRHLDGSRGAALEVKELAHRIGWGHRSTSVVAQLFAKLGLVTVKGEAVSLTTSGRKFLSPASEKNLLPYLDRCRQLEVAYDHLSAVLVRDKPNAMMVRETKAAFGTNRKATQAFVKTMHASALEFAEVLSIELIKLLPPNLPWRFLDVGCGQATLSCLMHDTFSKSRFRAFDLSGVSEWAEAYVEKRKKEAWITVDTADWNRWSWNEAEYDVVLLSQVLHESSQADANALFGNAADALADDGLLVVVMVGDGTTAAGDLLHSIFALNILLETGGENPSIAWLEPRAKRQGLVTVCLKPLPGGRSVWIGRKIRRPAPRRRIQ